MKTLKKFYGLLIVVAILIFAGFFFIDIGINSKFFIKRDFNQAFQYRITGDCVSFSNYVYQPEGALWSENMNKWNERCEYEKSLMVKIRKFQIIAITHKFGSDTSFLQVELTRNNDQRKEYAYTVNYIIKKSGLIWKIANQLNGSDIFNII